MKVNPTTKTEILIHDLREMLRVLPMVEWQRRAIECAIAIVGKSKSE